MDDLRANLPRMVVFARVVELGSFAAAARELGLSRPAVTAAVQALERSLGVGILHRTTRSLHPTDVGEELAAKCIELTELARGALADASATSEHPVGTLRVAAPSGIVTERLVAPALSRLAREHGVVVDLHSADHRVRLVEGGYDAAIRFGTPVEAGLTMRRLGRVEEVLVATPALARTIASPEDLVDAPWVEHRELPRQFVISGPGRRRKTITMRPVARVNENAAMLGLIRNGIGIGRMLAFGVADELARGELERVLPQWHAGRVDAFVLMPSRRPPRRVRLLIDALRDVLPA